MSGIETEVNEYPWQAGLQYTCEWQYENNQHSFIFLQTSMITQHFVEDLWLIPDGFSVLHIVCIIMFPLKFRYKYFSTSEPLNQSRIENTFYQVLLREHDTTKADDHIVFGVESIEIHDSFDPYSNLNYDFSMIKLETEVDFQAYPNIRPICLPTDPSETYTGVTATVTGWGAKCGGQLATVLNEVNLTVLSNVACK